MREEIMKFFRIFVIFSVNSAIVMSREFSVSKISPDILAAK